MERDIKLVLWCYFFFSRLGIHEQMLHRLDTRARALYNALVLWAAEGPGRYTSDDYEEGDTLLSRNHWRLTVCVVLL
jgi:hypothetical protein